MAELSTLVLVSEPRPEDGSGGGLETPSMILTPWKLDNFGKFRRAVIAPHSSYVIIQEFNR